VSSVNRKRMEDLPVPESPMRSSLKVALTSSGLIVSRATCILSDIFAERGDEKNDRKDDIYLSRRTHYHFLSPGC
jgi:hypothetical protein